MTRPQTKPSGGQAAESGICQLAALVPVALWFVFFAPSSPHSLGQGTLIIPLPRAETEHPKTRTASCSFCFPTLGYFHQISSFQARDLGVFFPISLVLQPE